MSLDIPVSFKLAAIQNITMVAKNVPPEYLGAIIDLLVVGVQKTFLFGLSCAVGCVVATLIIPWKPLQTMKSPIGRVSSTLPFWKKRPEKSQGG